MRRGVDAECGCAEAEAWGGGRAVATVLVVLGVQVAARRAAGGAADRQAGTRQADSLIETIVRLYICARGAVICVF